MKSYLSMLLLVSLVRHAIAFSCQGRRTMSQRTSPFMPFILDQHHTSRSRFCNAGLDNENDDNDTKPLQNSTDEKSTIRSTARIGGRRKKSASVESKSSKENKLAGWIQKAQSNLGLTASILVLCFLLKSFLFSGDSGGDSSYYYYSYESSVFESRTYGSDGQVQVSRKESKNVKSNIPGMKEQEMISRPSSLSLFPFDSLLE
eukprot:scaffold6058_cov96-Cylindrotheca_fusiformis.AAC.2